MGVRDIGWSVAVVPPLLKSWVSSEAMEAGTEVWTFVEWQQLQGLEHRIVHSSGGSGVYDHGVLLAAKGQGQRSKVWVHIKRERLCGLGHWLAHSSGTSGIWDADAPGVATEPDSGVWAVVYLSGKSGWYSQWSKLLGYIHTDEHYWVLYCESHGESMAVAQAAKVLSGNYIITDFLPASSINFLRKMLNSP